jgi:hypothetical protein
MRRHLVLPLAATMAVMALGGCSEDSSKAGSSSSSSASADVSSATPSDEPSDEPSASASAPTPSTGPSTGASADASPNGSPDLPEDPLMARNLHTAVLGRNAARTPEEKAVVSAWMDFWQGAADTYYRYEPTDQFDRVARGKAREDVLDYLARVKAKKQRVVGWSRDNVRSVRVDGDRATVHDCTKNFTFTVDAEAEPVTRPTPYYDVTGTLEKVDGQWTVVRQTSRDLAKSCL